MENDDSIFVVGKTFQGGTTTVSGFKHSLVPIIASAVLPGSRLTVADPPELLEDVRVLQQALSNLGASVLRNSGDLIIESDRLDSFRIPSALSQRVHGTIYLLPTVLQRLGRVIIGPFGGCKIGSALRKGERPVHHVLDVLTHFGAKFRIDSSGKISGRTSGLTGAILDMQRYSGSTEYRCGPLLSGATKTALLAAVTAKGQTIIKNPYWKLDVKELCRYLQGAGAHIEIQANRLVVEGRPTLRPHAYLPAPDLIEVMTFIACAICLKKTVTIAKLCRTSTEAELAPEFQLLRKMGIRFQWTNAGLEICPGGPVGAHSIDITPDTIFSDVQPILSLMLLFGTAPSDITEHVWIERFSYVRALRKMGAQMRLKGNKLTILPSSLSQPPEALVASDLRSAATLLIAALCVKGTTKLTGVSHLNRGYEDIIKKLGNLGATINSATLLNPAPNLTNAM